MTENGFHYVIMSFWLVQNLSEEGFLTGGNDNNDHTPKLSFEEFF